MLEEYFFKPLLNIKKLKLTKNTVTAKTARSRKVLPLLAKSDENSSYNVKNTSRYIKEKGIIPCIPYNVRFMEAVNEARTSKYFISQKLGSKNGETFFDEVERACLAIINKLKELNM